MQDKADLGGPGLKFDASQKPHTDPRYLTIKPSDSYKDSVAWLYRIIGFFTGGRNYRPVKQLNHGYESVHQTAMAKINGDPKYNPKNNGL